MSKKSRLLLFLTIFFIAYCLNIFTQILFTQNLSPEDYGKLSSILAFLIIITSLSSGFGINDFLQNYLSRENINFQNTLIKAYKIILISLLVSGVISYLILIYLIYPKIDFFYFTCIFAFLAGLSFFEISKSVLQIKNKLLEFALFNLLLSVLRVIGVFLGITLFSKYLSIDFFLIIFGILGFILILICFYYFFVFIKFDDKKNTVTNTSYKFLIYNSSFFGFSALLYLFFSHSPIIFIDKLINSETAGFYQASLNVFFLITLLQTIVMQRYYLPKIHKWYYTKSEILKKFFNQYINYTFYFSILIASILYFLSDYIIIFIYGENYLNSSLFLKFFSFLIPLRYLNIFIGTFISTGEHFKIKTVFYLKTVIIFTISCFVLTYYFNIFGTFFSMLISEVYLLFNYYTYYRKDLEKKLND